MSDGQLCWSHYPRVLLDLVDAEWEADALPDDDLYLPEGAAQFMAGYEAANGEIGLDAFLARADELAERYGERFRPTAYLRDLAARGERFPA